LSGEVRFDIKRWPGSLDRRSPRHSLRFAGESGVALDALAFANSMTADESGRAPAGVGLQRAGDRAASGHGAGEPTGARETAALFAARITLDVETHSDGAVPTGFEPAISSLTGTYARPLHHGTGA
jgi:hypothetical protein